MDFSQILAALNQASGFELYRLRAAIDRVLDDPKWIQAIRAQLRVGQKVDHFDAQANRLRPAQILEFKTKDVAIRLLDTEALWLVPYTSINVDGVDISIRENPQKGLGRHEVAVGDTVGFLDREQQQRSGQIIRLNDKTVTLVADGQQWRVAYTLLHRVY